MLLVQILSQQGEDLVRIQGLGGMGVHPAVKAFLNVLLERVGADGDDRDGPRVLPRERPDGTF